MSLFDKYYERIAREPSREYEAIAEKTSFGKFKFLCENFFWRFVLLNLLFIAACIPVITIPASIAAMYRVCMQFLMEQHVDLRQDFFRELKKSFLKAWLIVLVGFVLLVMIALAMFAYSILVDGIVLMILISISLLLILWIFAIECYSFSLLASTTDTIRVILKNAILMSVSEIKTTLIIVFVAGTILFALAWFFPITLVVVLAGIMAFICLFICSFTIDRIMEYVPR